MVMNVVNDYTADNFNKIMICVSRLLKTCPSINVSGKNIKEIRNFQFVLTDPDNCICNLPARKISMKYLSAETLWYLSQDYTDNVIGLYGSLWKRIAEDHVLNSNYGNLIFDSQFKWMIDTLSDDITSRRAILNINRWYHKHKVPNDLPCTMFMQFIVRHNYLNCYVFMRSNDLIYGATYDVPFFCMIHRLVHLILRRKHFGLKLGQYIHYATSLHVYERHYKMLNDIAGSELEGTTPFFIKIDDKFINDLCDGTCKSNAMRYLYEQSKYPIKNINIKTLKDIIDRFINKNTFL